MRGGDDRTSSLPRMMQRRLDEIYQRRGLDVNTLDQRCLNALGQLPVNAADEALDQLESQDLAQIRSVPAWFMSIIKRANTRHSGGQGGYRTGPGEYGRGAGGGPIGGGHHGPPPAGMMGGVAPFGGPQPPPSDRYGPPPPRPPPRAGGSGDFGSSGYRNDRFDGPPPPGDFGMGMGMMGVGIQGMPGPGTASCSSPFALSPLATS